MAEEILIPDTTPIRIKCENLSASIIKMAEEILIKEKWWMILFPDTKPKKMKY